MDITPYILENVPLWNIFHMTLEIIGDKLRPLIAHRYVYCTCQLQRLPYP